jgi:hypothetical protein
MNKPRHTRQIKGGEFETFKKEAGLNSFYQTALRQLGVARTEDGA